MRRLIQLTLAAIIVTVPVEAKDLYVNNSGSPACSDSTTYAANDAANPWCTIGRAAWGSTTRSSPDTGQAAQAGDTVYISAGTYNNTGTSDRIDPAYNPVNSGTVSSPIVFQAVGTVVLTQSGTGPVVGANGNSSTRNYITWRGFTINEIDAMSVSDTGPVVLWSTTGSRIEDFVIDGFDNGVNGNNHNGIRLENVTDVVIRNNRIFNVLNYGSRQMNGAGIMAYFSNGAIIEHNEIFNCGSGVFIKGGDNANFVVRFNEVYETEHGILAQYTSTTGEHRIYQNIVRNNSHGISARLYSHNVWIVNNTVVNNALGIHVIHWELPISETRIYNNIVRQASGESINGGEYTNLAEFHSDRNNYFGSLNWSINYAAYSSLASWRTALGGCPGDGNECASIDTNPLFADFAGLDLRLCTAAGAPVAGCSGASPALTIGRTITAIHGSDGQTIPAGAYITGDEVIGPTDTPAGGPTTSYRRLFRMKVGG